MLSYLIDVTVLFAICAAGYRAKRPLFDLPLDRDYGAHGYQAYSWMIGRGILYRDINDSKTPGLKLIYMLVIKFLGINRAAFRIFYAHATTLTTCAVYILGATVHSREAGLIGAALFGLYSIAPGLWWHMANSEVYYTLPATLCMIFLASAFATAGFAHGALIAAAGFMAGCAFMIKQTSILNTFGAGACFVVYLLFREPLRCIADLALYGAFFAVWIAAFYFYFVVIVKTPPGFLPFTRAMASGHIRYASAPVFRKNENIFHFHRRRLRGLHYDGILPGVLAVGGIFFGWAHNEQWAWLLGPWFLLGALTVPLSFAYLPYHFIPMVAPAAAIGGIMIARGAVELLSAGPAGIPAGTAVFAALLVLALFAYVYHLVQDLRMPPDLFDQHYTGEDRIWALCEEAGKFIRENTAADDTVYNWGSEQSIYLWSERRAASRCIFGPAMNPAVYTRDLLASELAQLMGARPKFFVITAPFGQFKDFELFVVHNYKLAKNFGGMVYVFQRADTIT